MGVTPVADWSPADFYAAFGRARAAWEQSQPQLTICGFDGALDEADVRADVRLVERVPVPASPVGDALTAGADPCHEPRPSAAFVADISQVSSAPSLTTTRGAASLSGSRGAPREGA